jgi:hypothetical protein
MRISVLSLATLVLAGSLSAQQQVYAPGDLQRVLLVSGTQSIQMRDMVASRQGSWAVVVSKQFYVFKGPKATLRTGTTLPEFEFETDPAFDDPVYLFRFSVNSDSREIRVAKGTGGLAQLSIPKDRIIETGVQEIGTGQNSTKRYRLRPMAPLPPGEYCLGRRISICYDFGVD